MYLCRLFPRNVNSQENLFIKNFTVLSVPSCILLAEVFASSSYIFKKVLFIFPYFKILQ